MKKSKKLILGALTPITLVAPIVSVVSCFGIEKSTYSTIAVSYDKINKKITFDDSKTDWSKEEIGLKWDKELVLSSEDEILPLTDASLTIPKGVTVIKDFSLRNFEFNSLSFPNSLREIKQWTFNKLNLTSLDLSNTQLEVIEPDVFANARLTSLKLPSSLKLIEYETFYNSELTSLDLSNTKLEEIGNIAFYNS